jgi:hypothetical protein
MAIPKSKLRFRVISRSPSARPDLEIGPPLVQRAVEEIVDHIKPAFFVRLQLIDIAVFENAGGER